MWVVDAHSGAGIRLQGTEGLRPLALAFSADSKRVAFRSADDGHIWIVNTTGEGLQRTALVADEAPIAW